MPGADFLKMAARHFVTPQFVIAGTKIVVDDGVVSVYRKQLLKKLGGRGIVACFEKANSLLEPRLVISTSFVQRQIQRRHKQRDHELHGWFSNVHDAFFCFY